LITASDGIMALLAATPIVFCAGALIASWASAMAGAAISAAAVATKRIVRPGFI
jgi:hypothetical protein